MKNRNAGNQGEGIIRLLQEKKQGVLLLLLVIPVALGVGLAPPLYSALLIAGLIVSTLIFIYPRLGLYLLILSVPIQDIGRVGESSNGITATRAILLLVIGSWLVALLTRRERIQTGAPLLISFIIFLLAGLLSATNAFSINASMVELYHWLETFIVYLIATSLLKSRRQVIYALAALLGGAGFEGYYGLSQALSHAGPASFAITDSSLSRAYGTFGMPNSYGGYLGMLLPLSFMLCIYYWRPWRNAAHFQQQERYSSAERVYKAEKHYLSRLLGMATLVAISAYIALGIFASSSRGAWIGTLGAFFFLALVQWRRNPVPTLTLIVTGLLFGGALVSGLISSGVTSRFASIYDQLGYVDVRHVMVTPTNFAVIERIAMWQAGINMFTDHPYLGVGIGNFNEAYKYYHAPLWPISRGHAHNFYIHVSAEEGIIGLITYIILLLSALISSLRAKWQTSDPLARVLILGTLGMLIDLMIHNCVENLHVLSLGINFAFILALPFVALRWESSDKESATDLPENRG